MFLKNAWYIACWSHELTHGNLKSVTLLNENIVLMRKSSGEIAALEDRCSHRHAPLSKGTIEDDSIRCMYHGLKFNADGKNIEVPFGGQCKAIFDIKRYPAYEKHSVVWVWTGNATKADIEKIPNFVGINHPNWAMDPGEMHYNANYKLLHDNLLDLTHIAFVHQDSFLGGQKYQDSVGKHQGDLASAEPSIVEIENGFRITRIAKDVPLMSAILHNFPNPILCDQIQQYDFILPGLFLMKQSMYPVGTFDRAKNANLPEGEYLDETLYEFFTCQAITPLTDKTTKYYYAFGPTSKFSADKNLFTQLGAMAFNEDKEMIEAQQINIDQAPDKRFKLLSFDLAPVQFNRLLEKQISVENI